MLNYVGSFLSGRFILFNIRCKKSVNAGRLSAVENGFEASDSTLIGNHRVPKTNQNIPLSYSEQYIVN